MKSRTSKVILTFVLALALAVPFVTLSRNVSADSFFGAIFTTIGDGTTVNLNVYDSKDVVFLNGGPQNQNSQGLPDGTYYYQVTDPSGATLLSSDCAECRQVAVIGGVISGATGPACQHANGTLNPATGSTAVKLMPFNDTPNNGGEYKVWLIRQTSTTSIDPNDCRVINFKGGDVKTDNFRVKKTECTDCINTETALSGRKFYDANANGVDNAEPGVGGVKIDITITTDQGPTTVTVTTQPDGSWTLGGVPVGATYLVCEELPFTCPSDGVGSYWVQTSPVPDSQGSQCYSGIAGTDPINGLDFGDICFHPGSCGLTLGFWSNKNGQAILKAHDTDWRNCINSLCLVNANGSPFKVSTTDSFDKAYGAFRTWLLNGNAVNMAYMLSVQLISTKFDTTYGCLSRSQLVDARSLGLGIVSIASIIDAAKADLCNVSGGGNITFTGNPLRQDEEIIKNALDAINNNRLAFASSSPCSVCYPTQ